jgi:hypothetical protein
MYLEKFKLDILKHLERAMDTGYFQSDSKKKLKGWAFIRAWLYGKFFCHNKDERTEIFVVPRNCERSWKIPFCLLLFFKRFNN